MYTIHECLKEGKDGHILILTILVHVRMWPRVTQPKYKRVTDEGFNTSVVAKVT